MSSPFMADTHFDNGSDVDFDALELLQSHALEASNALEPMQSNALEQSTALEPLQSKKKRKRSNKSKKQRPIKCQARSKHF